MEDKMTRDDAERIQSNADKFSQNQYFKARAQRSAEINNKYLTEEESLDILNIGKKIFHYYVDEGHIKFIVIDGNEKRYARFDVERLLYFMLDD